MSTENSTPQLPSGGLTPTSTKSQLMSRVLGAVGVIATAAVTSLSLFIVLLRELYLWHGGSTLI